MTDGKPMSLLLVEDEHEFRETCAEWMARKGHDVAQASNGHEALHACSKRHFDVVVLDMTMPGLSGLEVLDRFRSEGVEAQVIILTGQATVESAVQAMKLGAQDYLCKPFPLPELEERCRMAFEYGQLRKENQQLKEVVRRTRPSAPKMIGESPQMQQVFRLIERAGPSDKAILIQGESGTGKELVAKAILSNSLRADKPFVTINCAALPEQLVESELFGHEKGSFTGATGTNPGLFEVADGGTLFIDEIGELPLSLQPKLLRVLEDGSMRRVGSHKERRVDVRIVAATNRDLTFEVEEGNFREDLYYRINVLTIELPSLKDREGDVELLINHILGSDWTLDEESRDCLLRYDWPGNIRQLINVLERAQILADDGEIVIDDLPQEVVNARSSGSESAVGSPSIASSAGPPSARLEDLERAHVVRILGDNQGNKAQAARALGIHRRKLYRMLERFKIQPDEVRGS
ncbi:MAG: DNA-binding NtrC family response regulator [Planctomycetaceae bacterium]|jgi:DNA-binding NtrC family response regulator